MNNKNFSLPFEMVFKTNYCSACGAKLEKERTHRVVTPGDVDYFQYQDYNTFPRRNIDAYGYQFKCNSCFRRFSNVEQRIIRRIQKKKGKTALSASEIKEEYQEAKAKDSKYAFWRSLLIPTTFNFVFFILFFFFGKEKAYDKWYVVLLMFVLLTAYTIFMAIRGHKGVHTRKRYRKYSYENEELLNRLYAYSFANKNLVNESEKCYCFACKQEMKREEIVTFSREETAICPYCQSKAILPDAVGEGIDDGLIDKMNEYWF